jgi:hypothetical protein
VLKDDFKKDEIFTQGFVFINDREVKDRRDVHGLLPTVRDNIYTFTASTGASGMDVIMDDTSGSGDIKINLKTKKNKLINTTFLEKIIKKTQKNIIIAIFLISNQSKKKMIF